ncbi:NADH-quinone oxidoreductase subunit N [Roseivirga sp. E12]|uniref:NADH-quinone oxidoreductase subunit N n=1 Tax=Roseivirga sp. E12 TaxID=2819237 RepID=UPI001ABC3C06|nr:NADH-quinone oxidoreductase subunit N [Roseivirga sp. E12]MBO3699110.1 NADH-quinone oxidoreductase subunit N [Roseivirga sp. E12]
MLISQLQHSGLKEKLASTSQDLWALLPEIVIVSTIILLVVFDLIFKKNKSIGLAAIAFAGLAYCFVLTIQQWHSVESSKALMSGLLNLNRLSIFLKGGFIIGLTMALITAIRSGDLQKDFFKSSEILVMLFGLLLGASFMTLSSNLLMIYISIEVVSICSYILTGLTKGRKKAEAAMKYLIYGAVASAIMLYGMSWLYGFTGTLNLTDQSFAIAITQIPQLPLSIACVMVMGGFLFKLGAFPLHIWSPDVYEATPTPIVAVFSVLPKLAALVIIFKFVNLINTPLIDWELWIGILAIASMTVGNFSALWQKDIKRMLAYSSIAHAGFLLVGILAFSSSGNQAMLFYGSVYLMMNFGAFYLVQILERQTGDTSFQSMKGLGIKLPLIASLVLVVMIALTGLPPTAGFNGKLYIFSALWESYQADGHDILIWVFVFGLLNTVVALFYYLKLPYLLFFKTPQSEISLDNKEISDALVGTLFVLPLLLLFFRSDWFVGLMNSINFELWIP